MYDKTKIEDAAVSLYNLVQALRDGVDASDSVQAINFLTKVTSAASSFQADKDAAVLHLISKVMEVIGDDRVDAPVQ